MHHIWFRHNVEINRNKHLCVSSLVSVDVPILIGVECQFEDAVHDAAFDGHLGVLELLFTGVLPDGIMGHGSIQVTQEILHGCCLIVSCCAALKCCRTTKTVRLKCRDLTLSLHTTTQIKLN